MKRYLFLIFMTGALAGCEQKSGPISESERIQHRIDSLEQVFFARTEQTIDRRTGMELVKSYAKFYQVAKPKDSTAVDMLFKAAEVSMGIGQGNLAVKYFTMLSDQHPNSSKAPESLFLAGFCEENLNHDTSDARAFYEQFIELYPDHILANDARFSIRNMRLSDEELIRMFKQQNATDTVN